MSLNKDAFLIKEADEDTDTSSIIALNKVIKKKIQPYQDRRFQNNVKNNLG
jgi:hypothetical protein